MGTADFWRGKSVFVTGHTGFKGAWLCKILSAAGADVTGYALAPSAGPNLYHICEPDVRSCIGDIRDFDALLSAYTACAPGVVIHMAAQPLVLRSYNEPRYTYETNVMGTVNLLECVRLTGGARSVLNVTTDKVYLNRERPEGYREDEILNGYDPYSNSKSCSELVTSGYRDSFFTGAGVAVSSARSGNVIGGGDFAENRLIPDCAKALAQKEAVTLRHPHAVRPYQHVLDTLFAYLLIARRQYENAALAGAYNIGPEERDCRTNAELAELFCGAWGADAGWASACQANARCAVSATNAPHEAALLKLDCTKIRKTLGWKPRWNINESVKQTAAWYRQYYSGARTNAVMEEQIKEFLTHGQ